tara:strand:+ start:4926 stop:5318 length:393 start_codon:yes stop_codon:yes gene_type:complete
LTKICSACSIEQSKDSFNKRLASKDGLQHKCKSCQAILAKNRNYKLLYRSYNREYAIRYKYSLSEEEYDNLISQGCSICSSKNKVVMDHDHVTGSVRGPLCHKCNTALGLFDDDKERLQKAINYLMRTQL